MTQPQITISAVSTPVKTFSDSFYNGPSSPKLKLQLSLPTPPARDKDYYISDGNTVLLVQDTLFRVHMSTLKKDRSAFESMFSLNMHTVGDQGTTPLGPEGESDQNPIRLQGDTADEFRALLWSLYSLPHELMTAFTPNADIVTLYRLTLIAHKYQFRSIEQWALNALTLYYSSPSHAITLEVSENPSLVQITELAALCEQQALLGIATDVWRGQVTAHKNIAEAILIAERLDLRELLGQAYYEMLLKGREHWDREELLGRAQRIRLLTGHYELVTLWAKLASDPPAYTHHPRCIGNLQRCTNTWIAVWRASVGAATVPGENSHPGVIQKLELVESNVKCQLNKRTPIGQKMEENMHVCIDSALGAISETLEKLQSNLADYFTDII